MILSVHRLSVFRKHVIVKSAEYHEKVIVIYFNFKM